MNAVGKLLVTTPNDREVVVTRTFDAPRALVFDCHTKSELVSRWLLGPPGWTMPVCEIDLRVGGVFRYVWRHPQRGDMGMGGVFREIAAPHRLVNTEKFDQDWTGGETLVTTLFEERAGRTTVTVTVRFASKSARDAAVATGMMDGWSQSYDRLDEILAGREPAE